MYSELAHTGVVQPRQGHMNWAKLSHYETLDVLCNGCLGQCGMGSRAPS